MRQIFQNMSNGVTSIIEAPIPVIKKNSILIATEVSLVSAGTERMLIEFGKASYVDKARQQPEKVKMVLAKIKTDGIITTYEAVKSKLSQPLPLGYCNVGRIIDIGAAVDGFKIGDRVVSNGSHADIVNVTKHLCARIPDNVKDEEAVFTVIASIGLQGIRLVEPTLGELFVVIGTGLIGLLTIQLLIAHGCKVLAIDYDTNRLELAQQFGAVICNLAHGEDPVAAGLSFSKGNGVDGVIITASTKSSDPISQAAKMCRKRGRIVLVGVTGLQLNRSDFYEKELSFQVSCSYGPGRYDPKYEEYGQDYPIGFVRWTEKRNFEAILDMLSSGKIDVKPLITHSYPFEDAVIAYNSLSTDSNVLGLLLRYTTKVEERKINNITLNRSLSNISGKPVIGFIGAGNYASRILIPAFKSAGAQFHTISTSGGVSGVIQGKNAGFIRASNDINDIYINSDINTVSIVTRHDSHADLIIKSLNSGKNVFVEKPLCIAYEELEKIKNTCSVIGTSHSEYPILMVGYNRRFAPLIKKMKILIDSVKEPKTFIMTMNAGSIPKDHWTQDISTGGGRIIGEACHYIDLIRYLAGSKIVSVYARRMGDSPSVDVTEDKATITLGFEDGSFGTILYLANGSAVFPKERIEVFVAGRVLQLDNFRQLRGYGWSGFKRINMWKQDKGQKECVAEFLRSVENGSKSPIIYDEIIEVAKVTLDVVSQLRNQ